MTVVFSALETTGDHRYERSGLTQGTDLNTVFTQVTEVQTVEYPDGSLADSGTTQKSRDLELCDLPAAMTRSRTDNLHTITNM